MKTQFARGMTLIVVLAIGFIACGGNSEPIKPPVAGVPGAHPRLWLSDTATMARLTAAVQSNSPEWVRIKNVCDNKTEPPGYEYQGGESYRLISAFALCYRVVKAVSGDTAAKFYADKAINLLRDNPTYPVVKFTDYKFDAGYGIRNFVPALAIAYDWLYDYPGMDKPLKDLIITRVKEWLDWYKTTGYGRDDYISNYNAGLMIAKVMSAIALYNEPGQPADAWDSALAHYNGALLEFDQKMPGGHWVEGWNYGATVYQQYLWAASALKTVTNDSKYLNSQWLSNNIVFKMNAITPNGTFFYDDGGWTGNGYGHPGLDDMIVAGYAYGWNSEKGKIVRGYTDRVIAGGGNFEYPLGEWKSFLFYDPNSQPANLESLPKSYLAKGTGLLTMRSDWTAATGTWASFNTGPYLSYQGGQDKDQGHIELYKGAPLLIDTSHDYYGSLYTTNTVFHNTFTFKNRSDTTYDGQNITTSSCQNAPDANPIRNNAYSDNAAYAFGSGEFSAAYQIAPVYPAECGTNVVNWLNRSVLFLRPNLYIVYDQVQKMTNQTAVVPVMNLHFPTAPTSQNNNRELSIDNDGSRLQVVTVFPAASNSVVTAETKNQNEGPGVSNWHLSVASSDPSPTYQKFLTVMRAGLANPSYSFPTVSAIAGTNASGSFVSGLLPSESTTPIAIVFADDTTRVIPTTLTYSYNFGSAVQNYVAKLKPNTAYTLASTTSAGMVTVTLTEGASGIQTDGAGVLSFSL
jgi:hypothetical protein